MNMKNLFKAKEIPFGELEQYGIAKEAFLDLPKKALDNLLTGRLSPLMKLSIEGKNGKIYSLPAKVKLHRNADGTTALRIFPSMKEIRNDFSLTEKELGKLKDNQTIVKSIDRGNGTERCYLQLDKETNTVMHVKASEIHIPDAIGEAVIGGEQKERLRNGEPVEIHMEDTTVTVGVDLNDRTGFKVIKGDLDEWRIKKLIEWDRITPGATGYWQTSENGWEYRKEMEREREQERGKGYSRGRTF